MLADGSGYRMVPDFQSITLLRILQRPRVIALPVTIAALISILACMLLSRYLTLPLERLRRATQHIAAGDLAQRVAPSWVAVRTKLPTWRGRSTGWPNGWKEHSTPSGNC